MHDVRLPEHVLETGWAVGLVQPNTQRCRQPPPICLRMPQEDCSNPHGRGWPGTICYVRVSTTVIERGWMVAHTYKGQAALSKH